MDRLNGTEYPFRHFRVLDAFLRSPWYVLLVGCLTAASSLFALELPVYTAFVLIGICVCLWGSDLLALMPLIICAYVSPSPGNNPGRNPDSVFYPGNGGIYILFLLAIFAAALLLRLIRDPEFGRIRFWKVRRRLLPGMLLLCGAYLLSGLGMQDYGAVWPGNLIFALIQSASLLLVYVLFTGAVDWANAPRCYLAWTALTVGFAVLFQLLENYISGRIFMEGTATIDRELMHTGWGMHNNIGLMMAMTMPFAFCLATQSRRSWAYILLGVLLLAGVIASCSRTSMIVAILAFCVSMAILLRRSGNKRLFLGGIFLAALLVALGIVLMWSRLMDAFRLFFEELLAISSRDKIYVNGLKQLLQYPVFGGSFYPQTEYVPWDWAELEAFSAFFPPRWHNTWIQIGASCGFVGLSAYVYHRIQTIRLLTRSVTPEKQFVAISLAVLLAACLLDCHFFNVGPVLFYSMALAYAENVGRADSGYENCPIR